LTIFVPKKNKMSPIENLHYAIGELAYSVAKADGQVQPAERKKFRDMVVEELEKDNYGCNVAHIIFQIMDKDEATMPDSYHWALKTLKTNSHYLTDGLKERFICVMEKVASAYPPVTVEEEALMVRFRKDIAPLKGDPDLIGHK
jgi:uncharacterized tellurite resistance protein B-like protein